MTESAGSFQSTGREPCDRSDIVEARACSHRVRGLAPTALTRRGAVKMALHGPPKLSRTPLERLGLTASAHCHYGLGFLGVHQGRGANFVFIDWWADENELHHHVYVSSPSAPERLEYGMPTGPIACVWDMVVMSFERQAWLETILNNPAGPDPEAYLARRLDAMV